jgi:hypothetical protein
MFKTTLLKSPSNNKLPIRISNLLRDVNYSVFTNVGYGIKDDHRLFLAFMMAVRIQQQVGGVRDLEWRFFINPTSLAPKQVADDKPTEKWVTPKMWNCITTLGRFFTIH